jgi:predicted DNA-binding protein
MKAKRFPVNIDREDFDRLKAISEKTGIPTANLLRRAVTFWLDENADKLVRALTTK